MAPALVKDDSRPACVSRANRCTRLQRHPAPPGDLRPPEPTPGRSGRTRPAEGLASRRRHLHGGLAGPALRGLRRHRTRMGHGGRQASVASQNRRCTLPGKALLRPGEAAGRGGQARDGRTARRAGDALVRQAGPGAGAGIPGPIRRPVHRLLRPPLPPLRRSAPDTDRDAARRPVRRRQELARRSCRSQRPKWAPFDQRMADALVSLCKAEEAGERRSARAGAAEAAQAGGARRNRPTVVVHADLSFLAGAAGGAELDVLGPLSREVARRLACDAKVLVSADGPDGRSLNLGRTRRDPSDAQRLEIRRRDKGCRFPAAPIPSSPMCITCATGSTTVRRMSRTSSNCAINITAACTRWVGRCPGTPTWS